MNLKNYSVKKTLFSSLSTNVWLQQQTQGSFQFQVYIPFKKDIKGLIFWHHRLNCNWKPLGKKIPLDVVIIPSNSQILLNTFNRVIFSVTLSMVYILSIPLDPKVTVSFMYPHKSALNDGFLKANSVKKDFHDSF